jgi:CubicO group peptidase (beta-lactamase class C family)
LGSVTKTYTATALMRLVAAGQVELDAPVRRYVPELALADESAAARITVLNLLNHTAGLDWRINIDTGEGDDALAREVAQLPESKLIAPPGIRASYSQAGYDLAGRIVEKVTGLTYERASASLLFEPLGMLHSFFARDDVMTRRFAVGHNLGEDGKQAIARPWRHWRSDNPGAGWHPPQQIKSAGLGSISVTAVPKAEHVFCPPKCCIGCRGRPSHYGVAASAMPLASAGSCVRWMASAPLDTAARRTASLPTC